jgi:mono/diheme cytochrome c family protein
MTAMRTFGLSAGIFFASNFVAQAAPPTLADPAADRVRPYFAKHCISCHGETKQKADLRLDTLSLDFAAGGSTMKWMEVIERINAGEMPPPGEAQPTAEQSAEVVEWISDRIREGEAARLAKRERVSFHRLTREEYVHTVEDLLGVTFDAADPNGLPEDSDWNGFERIGSVLSLSPSHIEKYFAAAETVLAEALPTTRAVPFVRRKDALDLRGGGNRAELEAQGLADKVRVDVWPGHDIQGSRPGPGLSLPVAGHYQVRIKLSGLKPPGGRAPHLSFYAVNLDRMLHEQDVVAAEDQPTIIEFTTHLPAGNHNYRMTNDVPGPSTLPRSGRAAPRRVFTSIKDGRAPWQLKLTDEEGQALWPFLIVDWVEWSGPIMDAGPTYAQRLYQPADPTNAEQRRATLSRFAERAFRRPITPVELARYTSLVDQEIASGEPPAAALKTGMVAILCAKDFLYVVEGSTSENRQQLSDWELASRLSYFLWSTMPDDALFAAARAGTLHQPEELRSQVRRMLADPKAARFAEAFPRQWLQLRQVGMFPPDKKLYPDYDNYLEKSMIDETTHFFQEVLQKNLSLREFLQSDWTMLNARLAEHYGIPDVNDGSFQRVRLRDTIQRGGLLTHASVLSLTSDGTRHRPVHRGKWVMESIFGKSPPPPPANVKAIEPTPSNEPKATIRQKLEAHKSDANCASCHRKIDPLGLAFDNYDAIGRWRTEEQSSDGSGANPKVDASGELPDGRSFADVVAFKKLLLDDLDTFNATFIEKLAMFAMRRTMTYTDRVELSKVAAASRVADYRLPAIIEALVLSDLFQRR